jgi:histidinol phosphatase-like PHP family hydrolase
MHPSGGGKKTMKEPKCPFKPSDLEPIGSTWVLANFHTHTPGSSDYAKDLVPSGNASHEKIARGILEDCLAQNIKVVAITDHNSPSFVRKKSEKFLVEPEKESYYAVMRSLIDRDPMKYGGILVLPGVEIGAENIHVLGLFPPSADPGWDVLSIASILDEGNCPPDIYGDANKSCTEFSVADAIDIIDARGGIAIPAHIDGPSGFLKEESQERLLKMIVSRPHLYAVEYINDKVRADLEKLLTKKRGNNDIYSAREGRSIAWTQACDAHFVVAFNKDQAGNGMPIGTVSRRTWLRLDPNALSFEAIRATLLDPENRVRVDKTARPRGRQGAYKPLPSDRTYVRAMHLDWGNNHKEKVPFNEGINTIVGAPKAGKTARVQAFSVVGSTRGDLGVTDNDDDRQSDGGPSLKSVDMILECGIDSKDNVLWWIHRKDPRWTFVAPVEVQGKKLQPLSGKKGAWVDLCPGAQFNRRALRNHFKGLPAALARRAPAIPQGFSLNNMKNMLDDQARTMRFVEKHYIPDSLVADHSKLYDELFKITNAPGSITPAQLASKINGVFKKLEGHRKKAIGELNKRYKDTDVGLGANRTKGKWSNMTKRKEIAARILELTDSTPDAVFDILKEIEDRVSLSLKFKKSKMEENAALSDRLSLALKGLLLVIGARDLGPVVIDAPGTYFEPAELVETMAAMLLDARERGAQFVVSVSNTNLPFAVDANALLVCDRDHRPGRIGPLNAGCSGGIENQDTAVWALDNLDGGGDLFDRREQYYANVLGSSLAVEQGRISDVLLSMSKSKTS